MSQAHNPLCFAMDYPSLSEGRDLATRLSPHLGMLKVGLELFVREGASAVAFAKGLGLPVFLDLKLHDIPETVDRAVAVAAELGANVLTVHAQGGGRMLERAAARAKQESGGSLSIAAVTVLTSLDAADLDAQRIGSNEDADRVGSHVLRLALLAKSAGVTALVCSAHEVKALRKTLGPDMALITPGIRPQAMRPEGVRTGNITAGADDQKRIATPEQALRDGATWLVMGRPLRDAPDPVALARSIGVELQAVAATGQSFSQ
jgi:orotidine-5'-phosphate decarboxylase